MEDLQKSVVRLKDMVAKARLKVPLNKYQAELTTYEVSMNEPSFWTDANYAQDISKKHSALKKTIDFWLALDDRVSLIIVMTIFAE